MCIMLLLVYYPQDIYYRNYNDKTKYNLDKD